MDKNEIIDRISRLRTRANLSARALSMEIGMNEGYINRLESKRDFSPSMDVLLNIIEVCNSTTEEFFYYNLDNYSKDMKIINLLKKTNQDKKNAIITLLED